MPATTAVLPMNIPSSSPSTTPRMRPVGKPAVMSTSSRPASAVPKMTLAGSKTASVNSAAINVHARSASLSYPISTPKQHHPQQQQQTPQSQPKQQQPQPSPMTSSGMATMSTVAGRVSLSPSAAQAAAAAAALTASTTKKKKEGGVSTEVPIFLQKTYHMIDTCDPKICSWSEDGLTFVVKDTTRFESTIIPQFFKHNKFSSFVRQLNFYGFRKIKYCESLRINPQLEAETANYWRFKHDKFRQGRKDLLIEIKRSGSSSTTTTATTAAAAAAAAQSNAATAASVQAVIATNAKAVPMAVTSSMAVASSVAPQLLQVLPNEKPEEVTHLKTEVQELKEQIASMTKNIDQLTSMVKNISVKDDEPQPMEGGIKRKKIEEPVVKREDIVMEDLPMPDWNPSSSDVLGVVEDVTATLPPFPSLLNAPLPELVTSRENSITSNVSDDGFVDDLFQAFADEEGTIEMDAMEELVVNDSLSSASSVDNIPDPKLMKRIEDSLATIPKDMHEMVANRLIEAISNTQPIVKSAVLTVDDSSVDAEAPRRSSTVVDSESSQQPTPIAHSSSSSDLAANSADTSVAPTIPLPLAVATLRTILAEYGVSVECHRSKDADVHRRMAKALPVVPVHA